MILIKPKHPKRRYCYGGSGILDVFKNVYKTATSTLAKKVVNATAKDGLKVIKRAAKSKAAHKVADAVLNGATNATEKLVENVITDAFREPAPKRKKIGLGIVLD